MALSLREVLELQRRQREEKEAASAPFAPSSPSAPLQPSPSVSAIPVSKAPPVAPAPATPTGRGLLSRLQAQPQPQQIIPEQAKPNGAIAPTVQKVEQPAPVFAVDETEQLKKNLAFLAANMDEKELLGQILRTTVRQLQEHPELSSIVIDTDYDLIVAAARRSMKFATRKKEDRVEKAGKKTQDKNELDAWLKDQGIEL